MDKFFPQKGIANEYDFTIFFIYKKNRRDYKSNFTINLDV